MNIHIIAHADVFTFYDYSLAGLYHQLKDKASVYPWNQTNINNSNITRPEFC